jgi:hypothetical protein
MLKLMKYDLRRNRDKIWGALAVIILLQTGIWISARVSNWDQQAMFIMNVAVYVVSGAVLLVQAGITYGYNLKSYHRRLLPLKPIYTVLSPLLMYMIMLIGIIVLAALHLGLYSILDSQAIPYNIGSVETEGIIQLFLSACLMLVILMLSITVANCLPIKASVWVGIVTFVVFQNGLSWLEYLLFGPNISGSAFQFEINVEGPASGGMADITRNLFQIGPLLFEAAFVAVVLYVTTLLVKRKVDL